MVPADRVRIEAEDEAARLAAVMADGQQFIGWPEKSSDQRDFSDEDVPTSAADTTDP